MILFLLGWSEGWFLVVPRARSPKRRPPGAAAPPPGVPEGPLPASEEGKEVLPGWRYVRRGQQYFLERVVEPQERVLGRLRKRHEAQRRRIRDRGRRQAVHGTEWWALYWLVWGLPYAALALWALVQRTAVRGLVGFQRAFARHVVELPANVQQSVQASRSELASPEGMAGLRRAILNEEHLTERRRRVLVFFGVLILLVGWGLAEILVRWFAPEALVYKHETDILLYYGILTRLFLPTPLEVIVPGGARILGAPAAIFLAAAGATIGSWLLYLVGMKANQGIRAWMEKRGWGRRFWAWFQRTVPKFGYAMMGLILAIPFSPDAITALFAVMGLRLRWFLATIFLATSVRLSLVLWIWPN